MSTKPGWMEKRQHERVLTSLKVEYRLVEGSAKKVLKHENYSDTTLDQVVQMSAKSTVHQAVTKDISMGGMSLVGEQAFPMGAIVEVGLHLPHYKTQLKFVAEVVRSDAFTEMQRTYYRSGLKILAINKADIDHISRYLHIKKLQNELKEDIKNLKK